MALEVRLTDRARADIEDISQYLRNNWSEQVKMDFLIRLTEQMNLISQMPLMFRASANKPGVRECVMQKHTVIYYRIIEDRFIQILSIKNARRNAD